MIVISLTLKVKMEMMRVNMFEPGSDSDDSDNLERAIEQEDNSLDQSSDGEGQARRQHPLKEDQVEEAEEGHLEEGCVEPLQEGCDHDPRYQCRSFNCKVGKS